jgi:hypothetical protein
MIRINGKILHTLNQYGSVKLFKKPPLPPILGEKVLSNETGCVLN